MVSHTAVHVTNKNDMVAGFGLALLAVVLWSGNFIVAKALHPRISPISLAFFRWTIATLFLLPFAIKKFVREWKIIVPHLTYLSFTAVTGVTLFNTLLYVAVQFTTATNLAIIGTTAAPIFVLLISGLLLRQKIASNQVVGALVCIAGILVLIFKGDPRQLIKFSFTKGDVWIFMAALSFAIYTLLVRKKPAAISAVSFLFSVFLLGTLFLLPAYLYDSVTGTHIQWNHTIIYSIFYLGIGASVIAFLSWNLSIRKLGPSRTALFGNLIPIFSTIEASFILNEPFNRITVFSLLTILSGLLIANLSLLKVAWKK